MRLNWFSPLPPQPSGVADYTARLLPALTDRAEIRLWTDQPGWDPRLERHAEVRAYRVHDISWRDVNSADVTVYHMGNHPDLHASIWHVSRRCPGIVVLHDLGFLHFFTGLHRGADDRNGFLALMERQYGESGAEDARACWDGWLTVEYLADRYRLAGVAAESALGVLVHDQKGLAVTQRETGCPVTYAPLPDPVAPAEVVGSSSDSVTRSETPPHRGVVAQHSPEAYADTLIRFAAAAERFRLRAAAEALRHRVQAEMGVLMGTVAARDNDEERAGTAGDALLAEIAEATRRELAPLRSQRTEVLRLLQAAGRLAGGPSRPADEEAGS